MTLHTCGSDHQDQPLVEARCEYLELLRADLTLYAAGLDQPPTNAELLDLWAHARQINDDGAAAARWARRVLDLGWRPTIAKEASRG